jgi:hypothetical protein
MADFLAGQHRLILVDDALPVGSGNIFSGQHFHHTGNLFGIGCAN